MSFAGFMRGAGAAAAGFKDATAKQVETDKAIQDTRLAILREYDATHAAERMVQQEADYRRAAAALTAASRMNPVDYERGAVTPVAGIPDPEAASTPTATTNPTAAPATAGATAPATGMSQIDAYKFSPDGPPPTGTPRATVDYGNYRRLVQIRNTLRWLAPHPSVRSRTREAVDWFNSDEAVRYFQTYPNGITAAERNPLEFYENLVRARVRRTNNRPFRHTPPAEVSADSIAAALAPPAGTPATAAAGTPAPAAGTPAPAAGTPAPAAATGADTDTTDTTDTTQSGQHMQTAITILGQGGMPALNIAVRQLLAQRDYLKMQRDALAPLAQYDPVAFAERDRALFAGQVDVSNQIASAHAAVAVQGLRLGDPTAAQAYFGQIYGLPVTITPVVHGDQFADKYQIRIGNRQVVSPVQTVVESFMRATDRAYDAALRQQQLATAGKITEANLDLQHDRIIERDRAYYASLLQIDKAASDAWLEQVKRALGANEVKVYSTSDGKVYLTTGDGNVYTVDTQDVKVVTGSGPFGPTTATRQVNVTRPLHLVRNGPAPAPGLPAPPQH